MLAKTLSLNFYLLPFKFLCFVIGILGHFCRRFYQVCRFDSRLIRRFPMVGAKPFRKITNIVNCGKMGKFYMPTIPKNRLFKNNYVTHCSFGWRIKSLECIN